MGNVLARCVYVSAKITTANGYSTFASDQIGQPRTNHHSNPRRITAQISNNVSKITYVGTPDKNLSNQPTNLFAFSLPVAFMHVIVDMFFDEAGGCWP